MQSQLPSNLFSLSNDYTLVRLDRNWNDSNNPNLLPKKGGGVCTYIKNSIDFSETSHATMNRSLKDIEIQWISIFQKPNITILVGNCYRPPQGIIDNFLETLEDLINSLDLNRIKLFLMGDFNIDIVEKDNDIIKRFLNLMKQFGLKQFIDEPTRYSTNKNSILDLIFSNSDIISKVGVHNVNISDHQLILLTRKKYQNSKTKMLFYR